MYINGIIYCYFAINKIPIYTNNYPLSIYMIDFRKNYNKYFLTYENSVKIDTRKKLNKKETYKTKKILKKLTCTKNYLPWMYIKYKKYKKIDYKNFDYIVYAHSFLDTQLQYGNDEFENTYDWLEFTLNKLQKDNKKVLIKAHPNFYERSLGILYYWDNKIFNNIKKKYIKNKNFYFLNKPLFNYELLKKVNKKCILISHHGTVVLEGSYLGFKTIGSEATFYHKKFDHTISWSNKSEYTKLLETTYDELKKPNIKGLYELVYRMFFEKDSYYGNKFWEKTICDEIGISHKTFTKKIIVTPGMEYINSQKYLDTKVGTKFNKILNKLSKDIYHVKKRIYL